MKLKLAACVAALALSALRGLGGEDESNLLANGSFEYWSHHSAERLQDMLKNGPAWGVHSLVWCDSYNNVNRILDRMTMREFEMRVAFQMSAADSSSLLDNPVAAKLRQHRGLFASEDLGTIEKFRPYGMPTDAWLAEVRRAIEKS